MSKNENDSDTKNGLKLAWGKPEILELNSAGTEGGTNTAFNESTAPTEPTNYMPAPS